jgi:hypothetical protein
MGGLKPGAEYIYERVGSVVYAREKNADPSTRFEIGWGYDPVSGHKIDYDKRTPDGRPLREHIMEDKLWGDIRHAARTNPTLQRALEQCIIIHHLSKDDPKTTDWHPV